MVGKKTLKDYRFASMSDYYEMIVDSHTNGQIAQVKEQYNKLEKSQRKDFITYISLNYSCKTYIEITKLVV